MCASKDLLATIYEQLFSEVQLNDLSCRIYRAPHTYTILNIRIYEGIVKSLNGMFKEAKLALYIIPIALETFLVILFICGLHVSLRKEYTSLGSD